MGRIRQLMKPGTLLLSFGLLVFACGPPDWKRVLRQDCQSGLSRACLRWGEREELSEDPGLITRAREAYSVGCRGGEAEACYRETVCEQESPESPTREVLLQRFGAWCEAPFPEACVRAAEVADVMNRHDAAGDLYARACELEVPRACARALRVSRQSAADVGQSAPDGGLPDGGAPDGGSSERGLKKEVIGELLLADSKRVTHCFEYHMPLALAELNLSLRWLIDADGRVTQLRVTDSRIGGERTYACVLDVIDGLVFPRPAGGGTVAVTYPYRFRRAGEKE